MGEDGVKDDVTAAQPDSCACSCSCSLANASVCVLQSSANRDGALPAIIPAMRENESAEARSYVHAPGQPNVLFSLSALDDVANEGSV